MVEPEIIHEDKELMVIDKPAGMVVNRAESVKGETVQDWVEQKLKIKSEKLKVDKDTDFYRRAGIVHRLDKETSGLLLVAKTPQAFANLQQQFKERQVEKKYLALVRGKVTPNTGEITAPVGRLPWNRERFGVFPGGREAKTRYRVIKQYVIRNTQYGLLEITPATGRTHQIRVHLKYLGHPVFGDPLYAGRKTARNDRKVLPRLFLHAAKISFLHPKTGELVSFESNLPIELEEFKNRLERKLSISP